MEEPLVSFSVNLVIILRLLVAFSWGCTWAAILQFHRWGKFLAEERTWITVVIGIGGDLAISYCEDWWTIALVIAISSAGIIARSLWNESNLKGPRLPNKTQWNLTDITTLTLDQIAILSTVIENSELPQRVVKPLSNTLSISHKIKSKVEDARAGIYRGAANA